MAGRVRFTVDHPIVVDDDPATGEEIEHVISAGSVLEVDGVFQISGEEWADVRVPGYEDITTPVPVRAGLCGWAG